MDFLIVFTPMHRASASILVRFLPVVVR